MFTLKGHSYRNYDPQPDELYIDNIFYQNILVLRRELYTISKVLKLLIIVSEAPQVHVRFSFFKSDNQFYF